MIDTLSTAAFWKTEDDAFIQPRKTTVDRHVFLITKQFCGQTGEHFAGKLKELAKNCDFQNDEETLIRDIFITNLIDLEIQKELLNLIFEPRQALELAKNIDLGMRNQHRIQHFNKTLIPASVNAIQTPLVLDHRIGQSQTTSTNKAEAHLYIVRIVVETCSQTIERSESPWAKHVITAVY